MNKPLLPLLALLLTSGCAEIGLLIANLTGETFVPPPPPPPMPTLTGTVLERAETGDDTKPLKGVTLTAYQTSDLSIVATATTDEFGRFDFYSLPTGVKLKLKAEKLGYSKRERLVTGSGSGTLNFGGARGSEDYKYALDDHPSVTAVDGSLYAANPQLQITFSEPMKTDTVEDRLRLTAASAVTLSVGPTFAKDSELAASDSLTFSWNSDKTQLTLKANAPLPVDREKASIPQAKLSFAGTVKDALGVSASDTPFDLGDGPAAFATLPVPEPDRTAPQLLGLAPAGAQIICSFSEPVQLAGPIPVATSPFAIANPANVAVVEATFATPFDAGNMVVNRDQANTTTVALAADLARNYFQVGDTIRFDGSGSTAQVTAVGDYYVGLDQAVSVSDNEPVSLAKIGAPRLLNNERFFPQATVSVGPDPKQLVIVLQEALFMQGTSLTLRFAESATDPAGNTLTTREASAIVN